MGGLNAALVATLWYALTSASRSAFGGAAPAKENQMFAKALLTLLTALTAVAALGVATPAEAKCGLKCQACQSTCYKVYERKIFGKVTPAQLAVYRKQYKQCNAACLK
jgi:hypothetical protein